MHPYSRLLVSYLESKNVNETSSNQRSKYSTKDHLMKVDAVYIELTYNSKPPSHLNEPYVHRQELQYTGAPGQRHVEIARIMKAKNHREIKSDGKSKEKLNTRKRATINSV